MATTMVVVSSWKKYRLGITAACLVALLVLPAFAQGERVAVARFSQEGLAGWKEKSFAGNTRYQLTTTETGTVLLAETEGKASGLFKELKVDLTKTPYLNWAWRVDNIFTANDERSKPGDDYPARLYVVVSGGLFFWKTRAINYVWSSHQAVGSHWPNAFTANAMMLAVRSGNNMLGQWVHEKRDVRADFRALFGKEVEKIDAVAVMVDGDNTGQSARSYFGDIYFSAD